MCIFYKAVEPFQFLFLVNALVGLDHLPENLLLDPSHAEILTNAIKQRFLVGAEEVALHPQA
jgi:hypothetical protein